MLAKFMRMCKASLQGLTDLSYGLSSGKQGNEKDQHNGYGEVMNNDRLQMGSLIYVYSNPPLKSAPV